MSASGIPRIAWIFLIVGLAGLGLCLLLFGPDPRAFFRGYLPACLFWAQISLGSLALLMIHQLTGGGWGIFIRPGLKAAAATLPLTALLFVPLGLGLAEIYPWMSPDSSLKGGMENKLAYLNATFFRLREAVVFLAWIILAAGLRVWTVKPPQHARAKAIERNLRRWSALGLIGYGLAVSVFGIDWIMSLEPRWSSTNFGFLMMASPWVAALAFAIVTVCAAPMGQSDAIHAAEASSRLHDLGNLLLAGIMLWTYLEFQQYLAIWYENLPDKVTWYLKRNRDGWEWVTWAMALCYSALPFLLLLSRRIKRSRRTLGALATLVLAGNLMNVYWLVTPSLYPGPAAFSWLNAALFVAIGGLWLAAFAGLLGRLQVKEVVHE